MTFFNLAISFTLAAHLLLADVAMATPLACVWLQWRSSKRGDAAAGALGRSLALDAFWALLLAGVFGGLLVIGMCYSSETFYGGSLRRIDGMQIGYALGEYAFSLIALGWYAATWNRGGAHGVWRRLLPILGASNLIYHFPRLFSILTVVNSRPDEAQTIIDRAAIKRLMFDPEVLSRVTHIWLAAIAVTGAWMMLRATSKRFAAHEGAAGRLIASGARVALAPTLLQMFVGVWLFIELPDAERDAVSGGDSLLTGLLALGVLAAISLMHLLASVSLGDTRPRRARACALVTLLVVTLMCVLTRGLSSLAQ